MTALQRDSIDWAEIRRKIDAARHMTELGWQPTAQEQERILRARAQALACPMAEPSSAEGSIQAVVFLLAGETYAIELRYVREVYPLTDFTPVPCTPAFVLGIVNVRGQILSVIDLRYLFELPRIGLTELNKIIILCSRDMELGILADAVLGVQDISRDRIQPDLPTLTGIRHAYLEGVTPDRWVVLDGGRLLSDKALIVNEQVAG